MDSGCAVAVAVTNLGCDFFKVAQIRFLVVIASEIHGLLIEQ